MTGISLVHSLQNMLQNFNYFQLPSDELVVCIPVPTADANCQCLKVPTKHIWPTMNFSGLNPSVHTVAVAMAPTSSASAISTAKSYNQCGYR